MASDLKPPSAGGGTPLAPREKGVRIFTYPKIIFIFPTLIMSLICGVGMWMIDNPRTAAKAQATAPETAPKSAEAARADIPSDGEIPLIPTPNPNRFKQPENMLGFLFLGVFFLNLLILAIDFPRFTIFAIVLLATTITFFLLWLGMFVDILDPLVQLIQGFYVKANAQFYLLFSGTLLVMYGLIFTTRWLDYWEIMPNEILHHHGPLSDLERFPTMNLKFDKEIPDIFEHLMFGAGRLVLHIPNERKAIVLDTVLNVSRKEEMLKMLMSRMEVRVTTDQEVAS